MPRSVLVLSRELDLFEAVRHAVAEDTRFHVTDGALHCDGTAAPLTNIYPVESESADWEDWVPSDSSMPDPRNMSQLIFECRSPEWVAEVGSLFDASIEAPVWFLDATDFVWPAGQVDPSRIALA